MLPFIMESLTNKQIELLKTWKIYPFKEFSISEIMKQSGKNTKTWAFNTLRMLVKNNILISNRKANLDIYHINLNNPVSIQLLQYLEAQENLCFSQLELVSELIEKTPIKNYCLIIFGSYANNKNTKNSDIDICFLIDNKDIEKKIKPYVNELKLDHPITIDEHYITFEDFIKMLLRNEENLGKQIFRKHKIFYNADIYYQLIKEAYKNGFRQ
jgi:predicted nucleotidyltransferase